jgi:hypothetical protein
MLNCVGGTGGEEFACASLQCVVMIGNTVQGGVHESSQRNLSS